MKLLFDINHPAHVHLFKHAIWALEKKGYEIIITARDKDITTRLLTEYGFDYEVTSKQRDGFFNFLRGIIELDWNVFKATLKHKPVLLIGTSISASHVSKVTPAKSVIFNEDDVEANRLFPAVTIPFADYVVTPEILPDDFGTKQYRYAGNQELAYLHPNQFTPNPSVLDELGINKDEPFSVMRLVTLKASHDFGEQGLSSNMRQRLVQRLTQIGRVIITSETELSPEFEPYRMPISPEKMHDVLAYATLFIGDSQSMTAEAAVLGTPAVRCNTFVGRIAYLEELEHEYELTYGFLPKDEEAMLAKVNEILDMPDVKKEWQRRKERMLADKIDVTAWIVEFIEGLAA